MNPITVIITSCGRADLLARTLATFTNLCKYPIEKIIIHEDRNDQSHLLLALLEEMNHIHTTEIIVSDMRSGLSISIDRLMSKVNTEYVFHCEDDWLFDGNADFMADSLAILEERPDIHQVWCRYEDDHGHPLDQTVTQVRGVQYKDVSRGYMTDWSGFSWNPGLRRVSDYKRMFPNGYAEFKDEIACSRHANTFDYRAISLLYGACRHIGDGRHIPDFKV